MLKKIFVFCVLFTATLPAKASFTTAYLSPTGNAVNVGTSCMAAKNAAWFSDPANWGAGATQIGPGTTVHLCTGTYNAPVNTTLLTFQGSGSPGNYITLVFDLGAVLTSPSWAGNGAIHNGPDPISYIKIDGGTACGRINNMRVECNGQINATDNGSTPTYGHSTDSGGVYFRSCNHCSVSNLAVSNLFVKNTHDSQGGGDAIHVDGDDVLLSGNIVHDSYVCVSSDWQGAQSGPKTFLGNISYHCNFGMSSGNLGDNAILSGLFSVLHNEVYDWDNWDDLTPSNADHHNGIIIPWQGGDMGRLNQLVLAYNYFHGKTGSQMTGEVFIDCEGGHADNGCAPGMLIHDNIFEAGIDSNAPDNGMIVASNTSIGLYNNTFNFLTNTGGKCADFHVNTQATLKNNLFKNCQLAMFASDPPTNITASDFNDFYSPSNDPMGHHSAICCDASGGPGEVLTLPAWQMASGFDANSLAVDPVLNPATYVPGTSMLGTNVVGPCPGCSTDFYGTTRSTYHMGAVEPGGSPPPPPASRPKVNNSSLPSGTVGSMYMSVSFTATGGVPPYTWSAVGFPTGLQFPATGVLSGTPVGPAGTSTLSVVVNDAQAPPQAGSVTLPLVVNPAATPPPSASFNITATPASLSFSATTTTPQAVTIGDTAPSGVHTTFTLTASQSWLTLSTTSGSTSASVNVGVNTTGLANGTYNGVVTVTAAGASNSPLRVPVALVVTGVLPPPPPVHTLTLTAPVCVLIPNTAPPQYNCTMKGTAQ